MKNCLYFSTVWPQYNASAASERVFGIINILLKNAYKIHFISPSTKNKNDILALKEYQDLKIIQADPNNHNEILSTIGKILSPNLAVFDTFISEEFYSHHVHKMFPRCLKILDTQDLHSLRLHRKNFFEANPSNFHADISSLPNIKNDSTHAREMASIYRSDIVYVTSDYEKMILQQKYSIPNVKVLSYFLSNDYISKNYDYEEEFEKRKHFVWIGSFLHPPNVASLKNFLQYSWPNIRSSLPDAEFHVYGASLSKEFSEMNIDGVKMKGCMKNLISLTKYKVLLAPLNYGAGIKGKILDGWANCCPTVTNKIGAEGLFLNTFDNFEENTLKNPEESDKYLSSSFLLQSYYQYDQEESWKKSKMSLEFGGLFESKNYSEFEKDAILLYTDKKIWEEKIKIGIKTLQYRMNFKVNENIFTENLEKYLVESEKIRNKNHLQALAWSETLRSHEFLSKYINFKKNSK